MADDAPAVICAILSVILVGVMMTVPLSCDVTDPAPTLPPITTAPVSAIVDHITVATTTTVKPK